MGSMSSLLASFASVVLPGLVSTSNPNQLTDHMNKNNDSTGRIINFLVLFGSSNRPWNIESWQEVSDTVRGGSSNAKISYLDSSNRSAGVSFEGTLDTKTLGGAGFASQVYRHPISIATNYSRFFLEVEPIQNHHKQLIRKFTFGVKNTPIQPHNDQASSLIYQYDFQVPFIDKTDYRIPNQQDSKLEEFIKISIPFKALIPTFRGRPKPDEKPFDPHHITEISIMCRSFFDQQSGIFHLNIRRLGLE